MPVKGDHHIRLIIIHLKWAVNFGRSVSSVKEGSFRTEYPICFQFSMHLIENAFDLLLG